MAATFPHHEFHAIAHRFLETTTRSSPAWFCRATEQSFLRLTTSPRLLLRYDQSAMTNRHALAALHLIQARPEVRSCEEPPGTIAPWHRLAARDTASPKVWMDAYLAAFAIAGEMEFVTLDRDFKPYATQGLRLRLLNLEDTP